MNTTQVHRDRVGGVTVSTVLIEPFGYYETAILRRGELAEIVDTNISDADAASELHSTTLERISL